jgi:hypothetical protein
LPLLYRWGGCVVSPSYLRSCFDRPASTEQPTYGGLSADDVDLPGAGFLNTGSGAVPRDSGGGFPADVDHPAGGPRPRADAGIVDRAIGQEVFATGSVSPHRGTSQQASVAIDACIRDGATAMAGVMRCTKAGRADITANAQVETVSRGSLSWPENEKAQKCRQA